MLATFVIETVLAIWIGLRYSSAVIRTLSVVLLLCLASFQLAEYQVCVGPGAWAADWGRFGLVGITLLPALGMHLIGTVTRHSRVVPIGYALAALFALVFVFVPGATGPPECGGNYVIMRIGGGWFGALYEGYYLVFILLAIGEMVLRLRETDPAKDLGFSRRLVGLMLAGYLSFTIPMAITGLLSPDLRRATPSIMCGFALAFAVILASYVAPLYASEAETMRRKT